MRPQEWSCTRRYNKVEQIAGALVLKVCIIGGSGIYGYVLNDPMRGTPCGGRTGFQQRKHDKVARYAQRTGRSSHSSFTIGGNA